MIPSTYSNRARAHVDRIGRHKAGKQKVAHKSSRGPGGWGSKVTPSNENDALVPESSGVEGSVDTPRKKRRIGADMKLILSAGLEL